MTLIAVECPVSCVKRNACRRGMVKSYGCPGYRVVTFLTLISQLSAKRIILPPDPVTVVTTIGSSLDLAPGVAGIAFCGQVTPLKSEGSCLVKRSGCIPEAGRRMAIAALRAESRAMWILMTRSALRVRCLFQSLLVALVALKVCVPAGQIETGISIVVVILRC